MVPPFVKKFDFRGVYGKDITARDAYYLGRSLSKVLPLQKVLIGWDTRESSKILAYNVINALQAEGIEISYMAKCPIDYVTAGAYSFDFDLSIMFTGSHNPWDWTGLLMHARGGDSIQGELVTKIVEQYNLVSKEPYHEPTINLADFQDFTDTLEDVYAQKLQSLVPLEQIGVFTVLVDAGDGSGSRSLSLLERLLPQVKFVRINDRGVYDASSSHTADPSEVKNMQELMQKVASHNKNEMLFNCGFAFDSDADRVLAVDETGAYLNGSLLGSAMAECLLARNLPDTRFGYAVDCGPSMHNSLATFSATFDAIPVGRSVLRTKLRDGELHFGAENVGHFYAKDFFKTDSGVFALAVILYWMTLNGPLSQVKEKYPDGFRGQLFVPAKDGSNILAVLYEKINKQHEGKKAEKKISVDGVRYEFLEGGKITSWYTVRKSGYEQIEKYYFGALDEEEFTWMKNVFKDVLG